MQFTITNTWNYKISSYVAQKYFYKFTFENNTTVNKSTFKFC